jgi:putative transposase
MKHYLLSQQNWLTIDWLPGYAPDLNPTEGIWNNVKGREMANLCPDLMEASALARTYPLLLSRSDPRFLHLSIH